MLQFSLTALLATGLFVVFYNVPDNNPDNSLEQTGNCGNTAAGFQIWKTNFAKEAERQGIGKRGLAALASTTYSRRTIAVDRNQKSFEYSLDKFLRLRGADSIVAQGRQQIADNPAFYAKLEKQFGVSAAVVVAIHGMETGFGRFMGDSEVLSSISTLAYDCRRSEFFTGHTIAALKLVDNGTISPNSTGARHGELGHTQFLPGNILEYGVDGNNDGQLDMTNVADALASTANFLRSKGWEPGKGYQVGQPNFRVIEKWNSAEVYQKAIALMAAKIEK